MRLSSLLDSDTIVVGPQWTTFEATVRGLAGALAAGRRIPAELADEAVQAVCEREAMSSTSIVEISVSIPHARLEGLDGVAVALAASPTSLYSTEAGVPIAITALVLSAPSMAAQHLNVLSALSMLLQSEAVRNALRSAEDGQAAVAVLQRLEGP